MKVIKKRSNKNVEIIKSFLEDYNCNTDNDYYAIEKEVVEDLCERPL